MVTKPYWTDSWTAWVIENHKQPSDGTKNYAPATTRLQPKITLTSRQRQSGAEMKILGTLYLTLRVNTDLWNNKTITKKLKKLKRDCMRSMEKGNTRIHTKDQGRQRRSEQFTGTEEGSERVDRKTGLEVVRPSINQFFILKLASSFMVEIYTMGWAIFFLQTQGVFRLQAMAIPLQATGGVHRTPNPHAMSRSRTRDFSRAVFHSLSCQRLSHAQHVHGAQKTSRLKSQWSVVFTKTFAFTLSAAWHTIHLLWWFRHHWALPHFSLALRSALRPDNQRDPCRFHLLTRFTTATIQ